jgi:hypothetical protein
VIIEEKCASFKPYISKTPQIAATAPPKCQQHDHLHQHHPNPKFSQHSIFSTCRNSIALFLTSARRDAVKVGADFLSPAAFG